MVGVKNKLIFKENPVQNISLKVKKFGKVEQNQKGLISIFA